MLASSGAMLSFRRRKPSLGFGAMPTLNASHITGPRNSPQSPLRTSIVKLRRMNYDAEKEGKSKAGRDERRYLHLGREASIAISGDDSFLDEMEDTEVDEGSTMDEEKEQAAGWRSLELGGRRDSAGS